MIRKSTVTDFENYTINELGVVTITGTNKIVQHKNLLGYPFVSLKKNNKYHTKYIHRLLGIEFILNPENKSQINHIDGNKGNYQLNNLEWNTPSENCKHAHRTGLIYASEEKRQMRSKILLQGHKASVKSRSRAVINLDTGLFYDTIRDAAFSIGINETKLWHKVTKGHKKYSNFKLI